MDTIVLLDLEDTIIKHWTDRRLVNVDIIKKFIRWVEFGAGDSNDIIFGIYSYALWCDENMTDFMLNMRPEIEDALGIQFNEDYIFHMEDIVRNFENSYGPIGYGPYCKFISKEKGMLDLHNEWDLFGFKNIVLIDDTVTDGLTMTYTSGSGATIRFMNPQDNKY